jgi:E3 ubiquitin-protein ligase MARCH6
LDKKKHCEDSFGGVAYKPPYFLMRIFLFIVLMWLSLFSLAVIVLTAPVIIGRWVLFYVFNQSLNDFYNFAFGLSVVFIVIGAYNVSAKLLGYDWRGVVLKAPIGVCFNILLQYVGALLAFGLVLPSLLGALFELTFIAPLFVSTNEAALFNYFQIWALGAVLMKLVACVIMSGQVAPLRSLLDDARVNAANQRSGIVMGEFQLDRLTSHVALPLIRLLGLFLSVPYIVTRGLLPHFVESAYIRTLLSRFSYSALMLFCICWQSTNKLRSYFVRLHDTIRDEKYLINRELRNYKGSRGREEPISLNTQ